MSDQLTIGPPGEASEVADGQTIRHACLRAGIWLPNACGHGLGATCKVQIRDGEVDHGEVAGERHAGDLRERWHARPFNVHARAGHGHPRVASRPFPH